MRERANLDSNSNGHPHVFAEMREAERAARRLGVDCVQRDRTTGVWRPAARWAGSPAATLAADREVRLRHAEREMRATGPDADRRRRLRLAELSIDSATSRRLRLAAAERECWR
jgi:hypothetical protein